GVNNLKREAWTRAVQLHDLAADGLPLDDKDLDADGKSRAEAMSDSLLKEQFYGRGGKGDGNEVLPKTQSEAVLDLRKRLVKKIDEKKSAPQDQVELLCRVLLPLADTFQERDRLLTLHTHLAADPVNDRLRTRLRQAILDTIEEKRGPNANQVTFE